MKKSVSVLALISLLLQLIGSTFAYAKIAPIEISTVVGTPDSQGLFCVDFHFNHVQSLLGYKFAFSYDREVIEVVDASAKGDYASGNFAHTIGVEAGHFNILWNNTLSVTNDGPAFSIVFKRIKNKDTFLYYSYSEEDTFDENFENVIFDCQKVYIPSTKVLVMCDFNNMSDISLGFIGINRSSDSEMLIEDGFFEPEFSYPISKTDNIDVIIKPNNCIGLCVKNIPALSDVNINDYLLQLKEKKLFDFSLWPIGDVTNDNVIDIADISYLLVAERYGTVHTDCDLNHDDWIDIADLSVILSNNNYGKQKFTVDATAL